MTRPELPKDERLERTPLPGESDRSERSAPNVEELPTIGERNAQRLAAIGVVTTAQFLERWADPLERVAMSARTSIGISTLRRWAGLADLLRIPGIARAYLELLEAIGIGTIGELRARRSDRVADAMLAVAAERKLPLVVPSAAVIEGWIRHASDLDPVTTPGTH